LTKRTAAIEEMLMMAPPPRARVRDCRAHAEKGALERYGHLLIPGLDGMLMRGPVGTTDADIVVHDIDPAQRLDCVSHNRFDVLFVRRIGAHGIGDMAFADDDARRLLSTFQIEVHRQHRCARARIGGSRRLTVRPTGRTRTCAHDDCDFAFQATAHGTPPLRFFPTITEFTCNGMPGRADSRTIRDRSAPAVARDGTMH
jgi:hypothetical protein